MKESNISDFINKFVDEPARNKKAKAERESVMKLFNGCLANYGEIESNVERDPLIVTAPISELGPYHFRQFFSWVVVHKVIEQDKSGYVPILRDFVAWLIKLKVLDKAVSKEILKALDELHGEPERCEKLAKLLYDFTRRDIPTLEELRQDPKSYARKATVLRAIHHEKPQEVIDGYFTVARIGPTALWLNPEDPDSDEDEDPLEPVKPSKNAMGPVQVSPEVAKLARVGDGLDAAIGRMSGFWKLIEAGGVYPSRSIV